MPRTAQVLDLTIVWPMRLSRRDPSIRNCLRQSLPASGNWKRVTDLLRRGLPEDQDGYAYAEYAYFHPFTRRFLYGEQNEKEPPYDLYRRSVGQLNVTAGNWNVSFDARDVRLYVMDDENAILVVELSAREPVPWETMLNAANLLRTVSYQHFEEQKKDGELHWVGKGGLDDVRWDPPLPAVPSPSGKQMLLDTLPSGKQMLLDTLDKLQVPILEHWRQLLADLSRAVNIQPLGDHRAFTTLFAQLDHIDDVSDDEWNALAQADPSGFTTYAPAFRAEELQRARYGRWWDSTSGSPHKHAYLVGPMTFCNVIGFPHDRIRRTWHRQQFYLFLLAVFQRSALLRIQDQVAKLTGDLEKATNQRVESLQGEFAIFSSRSWFSEISPQIQGQELYNLLKDQLALDQLHRDVMDDKSLLTNWIQARAQRQRETAWNIVNFLVIPIGLASSFLGMNVLIESDDRTPADWMMFFGAMMVALLITALIHWWKKKS